MINTLRYNEELCVGCGMCEIVCPHRIFVLDSKKANLVNPENCIECGACSLNCLAEAITVDSGVGCAAAIINSLLPGNNSSSDCCCDHDSTRCC